jgi:NADH-quinone oxidoreductase subunit M
VLAVSAPIVPLHGWLPDAVERAPAGAAVMLTGIVPALGPYLAVRVGFTAMPEGARWAGASIAAAGVVGVVYGSLCAMAQRDLRRFVAYASIAGAGACLFGLGGLTPQGMAGSIAVLLAHGLGAATLLGVCSVLERRGRTVEIAGLAGVAREAPVLGALALVGLATSLGVPGFAGFWGVLLVSLGGFARHPVLVVVLAGSLVPAAAAHLRVASTLLARARTGAPQVDASSRDVAGLVPLAALAVLLGVWPAPLLSQIASGVREAAGTVDPSGPDPLTPTNPR